MENTQENKINWFKQIPLEYLYLNESKRNSIEKRLGKPFDTVTKEEALETELIINLAGIRWLSEQIGYKYSKITINSCSPDYAAATCEILFNACEYNKNQEQIYSQSASAHAGNTKSWYKEYLVEAAANRAFCRAVRFYCNIQCVSADELGNSTQIQDDPNSSNEPQVDALVEKLKSKMTQKGVTFEQLKAKLIKEKIDGAENFKEIKDFPKDIIFSLVSRMDKLKDK